jgi:NADH-quinone oxidoreductase subunit H
MKFGWKVLIPVSLVWILVVAAMRVISLEGGVNRSYLLIAFGVVAVLCLLAFFFTENDDDGSGRDDDVTGDEDFDAFAGGYPVPPMASATRAPATRAPATRAPAARTPADRATATTGKRD